MTTGAASPANSFPGMDPTLVQIVTDAGGKDEVLPYLNAMGVTSVALMSRLGKDEDEFIEAVVQPFIAGTTINEVEYKSTKLSVVTQSIMTVIWEDARAARTALTQSRAIPAPQSAVPGVVSQPDPEKVPKQLATGVWKRLVKEYNDRIPDHPRRFPETQLLGAEEVLARLLHELNVSRQFSQLPLGEIVQKRAFAMGSTSELNQMKVKDSQVQSFGIKGGYFTFTESTFTPKSHFAILDALEAIRWAYIFCQFGPESSAEEWEAFFKIRVRRAKGDSEINEVVSLYSAASWRLAAEMRGGTPFSEAVKTITTDQEWRNEVIDTIKRQNPPRGGGKDGQKGKKRQFQQLQDTYNDNDSFDRPPRGGKGGQQGGGRNYKPRRQFIKGWKSQMTTGNKQPICIDYQHAECQLGRNCPKANVCAVCQKPGHGASFKMKCPLQR